MAHGDITHIDIPVSDLGAGTAFYSNLFGWTIQAYPGYEDYPMWQAPNGISGGGLAPRSEGFTQPRSYVEVDSIEATLAAAVELGAQVSKPRTPIDETSWWAVLTDPDGNDVGLYEKAAGPDEA